MSSRQLRSRSNPPKKVNETSKISKPSKNKLKKASTKVEETKINTSVHELVVGDEIPDLTLLNQDEEKISLRELAQSNKIILIFAYPKASTPGCTRQACGFRDNFNQINGKALILGLSADSPKAQKSFKTKKEFPYDLLSDSKRELISILGAKKTPTGIKRSHWIFKDGKLVEKRVQISPEASFTEGTAKVLELAK